MPKYGEWWGDNLQKEATKRVLDKYSFEELNNSLDVSKLSNNELRDMATFVDYTNFSGKFNEELDYNVRRALRDAMNTEFDRRIGGLLPLYNMLDKKHNTEKWNGEERYKLLIWSNNKGYGEMSALKTAVWLYQFLDGIVTPNVIEVICSAYNDTLFWEFGFECCYRINCDESPAAWVKVNEGRKKEIEAQNKFIDYILEGKINEAYNEFIKEQVVERLK